MDCWHVEGWGTPLRRVIDLSLYQPAVGSYRRPVFRDKLAAACKNLYDLILSFFLLHAWHDAVAFYHFSIIIVFYLPLYYYYITNSLLFYTLLSAGIYAYTFRILTVDIDNPQSDFWRVWLFFVPEALCEGWGDRRLLTWLGRHTTPGDQKWSCYGAATCPRAAGGWTRK